MDAQTACTITAVARECDVDAWPWQLDNGRTVVMLATAGGPESWDDDEFAAWIDASYAEPPDDDEEYSRWCEEQDAAAVRVAHIFDRMAYVRR